PIRYILKHFGDRPDVGVNEGDGWISNDPFYGGVHSPDQSVALPVFHGGELVAWVSIGMHEGENGAREPGGMGASIESPWEEGLKLPPVRFAEGREIRPDFLNFMQNQSRDPRLVGADLKVRLTAAVRIERRLQALCEEYGADALIGALRQNVEFVSAEVHRRVAELPEGTVRGQIFLDTTMREDALLRFYTEISVRDGKLVIDFSGSAPQIQNRPINAPITSMQVGAMMGLLSFVWPDLPRTLAVLDAVEIIAPPRTVTNATPDVPTCLNMQVLFKTITLIQVALVKLGFGTPQGYAVPTAPWFNQPVTFMYGGLTQHLEVVGNVCAELNGMPGGAHHDADGEDSIAPNFAAKVDMGETEASEESFPFVQLISKRLLRDNCGFGRFRGGGGFAFSVANRFSDIWGFGAVAGGSRFPTVPGIFGGYSSPVYPIASVRGIDIFETLEDPDAALDASLVDIMNEQPFPGGRYETGPAAMPFTPAGKGELFLQAQGAGGGWGDVLERDPQAVMRDLEHGAISHETARDIFCVVYDPERLIVDEAATEQARSALRAQRLEQSLPYDEFVAQWSRPEPPPGVPYFGAWGEDRDVLWAAGQSFGADQIPSIVMPDPRELRLAELEARLRELEEATS
ncbi:MAG TPA: hydantoinase B/oxoprolinase family protein, partial [Burkholderiaceae bacterium]|nr:hydantoinase B/oxoprolinase family protein [Burkholderiaceae bacterium]